MKKSVLFLSLFMYCSPLYANELSDLQEQVTLQQKQILELQQQMQAIIGGKQENPAIEQLGTAPIENRKEEPRFAFKVKSGYNALSLDATRTDGHLRESTAGFGTSAELDVRLLKPLSFNLTFDGAILNENSSMQVGRITPSQRFNTFSETRLRLYTGSPNLKYKVFDSEKATAHMSLGYGFVGYQTREHNIFSLSATFGTTSSSPMLNSDLFAHGPRLGINTTFHPTKRLSFNTEAFYTALFDANWKVTGVAGTDRLHTEGYGIRWDLGTDYALTKRLSIGAGWRGYSLHTDLAKTRINQADNFFPETNTRSDLIYFSAGINY